MSASLFPPLPDELTDGHAGRIATFFAGPVSRSSRRYLIYRLAEAITPSDLGLPQSWHLAVVGGLTQTAYANQHTLLPAFRVAEREDPPVPNAAITRWARPSFFMPDMDLAHLCRECAQEDLSCRSYSWFRRLHNLPGIEMCLRHACPLERVVAQDAWCRLPHAWLARGETVPCEINPSSKTEHRFQRRLTETYQYFLGRDRPLHKPHLHGRMKEHAIALMPKLNKGSQRFLYSSILFRAAPAKWMRRNLGGVVDRSWFDEMSSIFKGSHYTILLAAMFDTSEEFSLFMEQVACSSEVHGSAA